MNKMLFITLATCSAIQAGELTKIGKESVLSATRLGLYHDGESFQVKQGGRFHTVGRHDLDKDMRQVNAQNLAAYLKHGKIKVNRLSNGDFTLRSHVDGLGGGPIAGAIAYWTTKILCWGGVGAAATTAVVLPQTIPALASLATAGGAGVAAATVVPVATGLIMDAGLAAEAALVVTGAASGAGGAVGVVAGIEAASQAAGMAFLAMPFLP